MAEKSIAINPAHVAAAGYARLAQTLRGNVPTIDSAGILTAANPLGCQADARENIRRNAELLHDLSTYTIRHTKGQYGRLENPYVVSNLPRSRLVELGVKYGQDAVIFARRKSGKRLGMGFELICTNAKRGTVGNVGATRTIFLQCPQPVSYGEPHGEDDNGVTHRARGTHFVTPFFDEDESREADWRGGTVLSYRREDLPDTPQAQEAMAAVLREEAFLRDSQRKKEPSHRQYIRRGTLNNRLRDLHRIIGHWRSYPPRWERTW